MDISKRKELVRYLMEGDRQTIATLINSDIKTVIRYLKGYTKNCSGSGIIDDFLLRRKAEADQKLDKAFQQ